MDNEKEIPFGAFDSELMHQEIYIPEGFEATIDGDKIILKKIESEDEKVRKTLIRVLNENVGNGIEKYGAKLEDALAWLEKQKPAQNINKEDEEVRQYLVRIMKQRDINVPMVQKALTWLEKQGKGKLTDKPKFKDGDWCIDNEDGTIFQIVKVFNDTYNYKTNEGKKYSCSHYSLENDARLWTIADAKDGDVLTNGDFPCIFKRCDGNGSLYVYCGINAHNDFSILSEDSENVWDDYSKQYFPATKEQRDTLFAKMKESGYEWLEETKELKKIEQESAEWKQENVEELSEFENAMMHIGYSFFGKRGGLDPNDTSSVKVQAQYLLELAQKPAEWSEEDKNFMYDTLNNLTELKDRYGDGYGNVGKCIDWLKSLKQRIGG